MPEKFRLSTTSKKHRTILVCLTLLSLVALTTLANEQGQPVAGTNSSILSVDQGRLRALAFLETANMNLVMSGVRSWGDGGKRQECYRFTGVDKDITIDVDMLSGDVYFFKSNTLARQTTKGLLTQAEAEKNAKQFLLTRAKVAASLLAISICEKSSGIIETDEGKAYTFAWRKVVKGITHPTWIHVRVNAGTGKIVYYHFVAHKVTLKDLTPKISKQLAIEAATKTASLKQLKTISANLVVSADQVLEWVVQLQGLDTSGYSDLEGQFQYEVRATRTIDAETGRVLLSHNATLPHGKKIVLRHPVVTPKDYVLEDTYPMWTGDETTLTFLTSRTKAATKNKYKPKTAITLANPNQALVKVIQMPQELFRPSHSLNQRIAFDIWETVYIVDLKDGTIGRVNDPKRVSRQMPAWNPTGKLLATSGTHSPIDRVGTEDEDIFVSQITDKLSIVSGTSHKCLAHLPGRDILPNWTPDGKTVVFAHQDPFDQAQPTKKQAWILHRVRSDLSYQDKEYQAPQSIVTFTAEPERISMFPDGKRVLVSYLDNEYTMQFPPQIVDIGAKTARTFKLPVLHDPDLPKGKPLIPRELTVSPDGKRIAFRALRWSGNPKDAGAICIYTCNLNGLDLKRITPPTNVPMQAFKYPQPGVTALNAWEKLQPKRNTGVLTDFKQEQHEWLKQNAPPKLPPDDPDYKPVPAPKASTAPIAPIPPAP